MIYKINEVRKMFITFFKKNNHTILQSSSLIPPKKSNLLFTNAGMNQFQEIFLGKKKPPALQIATIQKCLRTGGKHNDLEQVGNSLYHHTFFEMLGNFSFGSYFKKESIQYAWKLLTNKKWFNIPKNKLFVTVYYNDLESYTIWKKIIKLEKKNIILIYDKENKKYKSDNFWYMDKTGPCGPCTEIFFNKTNDSININNLNNKDKYVEIWNIVFIQFNKINKNTLIPLQTYSVDTGMGLERITSILQHVNSNYQIDLFKKIQKSICYINQLQDIKNNESINIISDHIRAAIFIINEDITPSNEYRGYILRRIIRRALMHGHKLNIKHTFLYKLVHNVIKLLAKSEKTLLHKEKKIKNIIKQEELQFIKTLQVGLKLLKSKINKLKNKELDGNIIFYLYDTIGFPIDLTKDICKEKNIHINYQKLKNIIQHQKKIREEKQKKKNIKHAIQTNTQSTFEGYNKNHIITHVQEIFINGKTSSIISQYESGIIILNKTTFYGESGGQIGDNGIIYNNNAIFKVTDTQNFMNAIGHIGYVYYGTIQINDIIATQIHKNKRIFIQNNHSVTHLLYSSLKKILKYNIEQKGSFINEKHIRFDFSYPKNIKNKKIEQIEHIINEYIQKNITIKKKNTTFEKAKSKNYHFLKNKNYNDSIQTISIKKFSKEICKGTHTNRTGNIGIFKIISFKNIASGIKRIEAITGKYALQYIHQQSKYIQKINNILKSDTKSCIPKIQKIINRYNEIQQQNNQLNKNIILYQTKEIIKKIITIKKINFFFQQTTIKDKKLLKKMIEIIIKKIKLCIIIFFYKQSNKYIFIIYTDKELISYITSLKIIKIFKKYTSGSGGGKVEFAQYATNNITKINLVVKKIKQYINTKVK
ncbi:Alanine--tRNA ligase [Buchnera aphidicola (Pterocallis alni)]|uniref:alanine--tRNA ligase n=1 Tax=Buchnera aphidicola TaxID=9 RepID=UPI003463C397